MNPYVCFTIQPMCYPSHQRVSNNYVICDVALKGHISANQVKKHFCKLVFFSSHPHKTHRHPCFRTRIGTFRPPGGALLRGAHLGHRKGYN